MKIAILTTKKQWFEPYAETLSKKLGNISIFNNHIDIKDRYDIVFILSYHKIIPAKYLENNKHNIVVHASLLPKGKGWSPLFWQVIEGVNKIPFTMLEASDSVDSGDIYLQQYLHLTGSELNDELREKQANFTIELCIEFLNNYDKYKAPRQQIGTESFHSKRGLKDSQLDLNKSIKEQFNLLRVVNNNDYPAFFELDGNRYTLKIELDKSGGWVELIDFVDLTLDEKLMILDWRNSGTIRKWMYSQNEISIDGHINFINGLLFSKNSQYMVVKKENKYIGVIDFTKIDFDKRLCYFGLYANPFKKIIGAGRILEEVCLKYAFELLKLNKLKLEVFSDNSKAMALYERFNFKKTNEKYITNKLVTCMELIK